MCFRANAVCDFSLGFGSAKTVFCGSYPNLLIKSSWRESWDHRRTAWGVQKGKRRPQATRTSGGTLLKRPYSRLRGGPPTVRRRVGYGGPGWNSRESMATPSPFAHAWDADSEVRYHIMRFSTTHQGIGIEGIVNLTWMIPNLNEWLWYTKNRKFA
jgi:hypothetical protein